ncbi:hypothetical protein OSTOST_03198, partial [Ostertagia ostertagi]
TAQQTRERILSFAWLPYDVLAVVRQENVLQQRDCITVSTPLYEMLKQRVAEYLEENNAKFFSFMEFHDNEAVYQLKIYTKRYPGLGRVMFIISEWADRNGLFTGRLQSHHICLILILYATGRIVGSSINHRKPFFESLEGLNTFGNQEAEEMEEEQQIELFVAFFEYLASREFRKLPHLSFEELHYASVFLRGEWIPLHEAAVKTYYNMVFNLRFDEMSDDPQIIPRSLTVRECEPFVIELPEDINDKRVQQRIMEKTGVDEVALRRLNCKQEGRVAVSARGTVQSLRALRELVTVKPLIKTAARGKEISEQLCRLTYENIMR